MKKIVMTAAVLACAASIASAQTVTSANIVGYYKVAKPAAGLEIASIQMKSGDLNVLLGTGSFVGDIFPESADNIIMWDKSVQNYVGFALYDGSAYGDPTVEWRDIGDFYTAGNPIPVAPGSAMWLSSQAGSAATTGIVAGEAVLVQFATNTIVAGLNLVSFPFSSAVDLNAAGLDAAGATGDIFPESADNVIAWDSSVQNYIGYALYDGNAYGDPTREWRPIGDFYTSGPVISLDLGKGFWYQAIGGFTWIATNPYFNNL